MNYCYPHTSTTHRQPDILLGSSMAHLLSPVILKARACSMCMWFAFSRYPDIQFKILLKPPNLKSNVEDDNRIRWFAAASRTCPSPH